MRNDKLRIVLISPKGPLYRHRGGIFGRSRGHARCRALLGGRLGSLDVRKALALAMWRLDAERNFDLATIERVLKSVAETLGRKFKDLVRVYYIAMTGSPTSLPLFDSMELLGRDLARERFRVALDAFGGVSQKEQKEWQRQGGPEPA